MKLEQLTFTRFIAAISIVIYHYGKEIFPFNQDATSFLFRQANIGVSYFFILSGFVMIIAYGNKGKISYTDFIKRRFARIYPVYLLAIIFLLPYLLLTNRSIDGLFLNLTMVQSWVPGKALSLNTPGWSLSVELFFYLSFPLLFNKIYSKQNIKNIFMYVLLIFIISQILFHLLRCSSFYNGYPSKSHDFAYYFPLMHLNEFLIGNLAGLLFINEIKIRNHVWVNHNWGAIIPIMIVVVLLKFDTGIYYHNGILAIFFVPLIVMISSNKGIITEVFSRNVFVFLGEISYGVYILQKPIYMWVTGIFKFLKIESTTLIFYTAFAILILVSAVSYVYIERPLRRMINNVHLKQRFNRKLLAKKQVVDNYY